MAQYLDANVEVVTGVEIGRECVKAARRQVRGQLVHKLAIDYAPESSATRTAENFQLGNAPVQAESPAIAIGRIPVAGDDWRGA